MTYLLVAIILFVAELLYFKVADRFDIIDKPNERSLHIALVIRGGGVVFWVAALVYFIYSGFSYPFYFVGLTAVAFISFLDDIFTLSNRYRISFQFLGVGFILWQVDLIQDPYLYCIMVLIVGVGILNAYNFMDGINGITGGYSLVTLLSLWIINDYFTLFIENDFLYFIILSLVVFNFFNFRTKAKCFAGDVGSISIAAIIIFLLLKLIIIQQQYLYILLLSVYGVDSVLTIIHRLWKKENIFKAHRSHLFQVIVANTGMNHLVMTGVYLLVQIGVNGIVLYSLHLSASWQWVVAVGILVVLSSAYIFIKRKLILVNHL